MAGHLGTTSIVFLAVLLTHGVALPSVADVPAMDVDEALGHLPPRVGQMFVQVQQGGGDVPVMVGALNQVYLGAMEDRDTLSFRCKDADQQSRNEVEEARSELKQAERSLTILRDRMQSQQASRDRSALELQALREQFEEHRTTCLQNSLKQAAALTSVTNDLPIAREIAAEVTQDCDTGAGPPELSECVLADGAYMVVFRNTAMRQKAGQLQATAEKLLTLQLERSVRAELGTRPALQSPSFLQMTSQVRNLRGQRQSTHHKRRHHRRKRGARQPRGAELRRKRRQLFATMQLSAEQCKQVTTVTPCDSVVDQMATFLGGMQDLVDELKERTQMDSDSCKASLASMTSRINELKRHADDAGVALANAVAEENELSSSRLESRTQLEDLTTEADHRSKECSRRLNDALSAMGGAKAIAQELVEGDGLGGASFVGSCEITDWVSGPCSAPCGGGTLHMTRRIVRAPPGATPLCPPTELHRVCNDVPCAVDGVMGRWEEWSGCSRACGGGIRTRFRKVVQEARHGGLPTGETVQQEVCNSRACDQDCVLSEWTGWGNCSKVCNGGHRARVRNVLSPELVGGICPLERDPERLETRRCNKQKCPDKPLPKCTAFLDLVMVLDSSGSMGEPGFTAAKQFLEEVISRMSLGVGSTKTRVGAVSFASAAAVQLPLTAVPSDVISGLSGIAWDKTHTNTGQGVAVAGEMLAHQARPQAQKAIVVITDGMPTSAYILSTESDKLQQQGVRIGFVLVGHGVGTKAVQNWVSWPAAENVVQVPTFAALKSEEAMSGLLANLCPIFE